MSDLHEFKARWEAATSHTQDGATHVRIILDHLGKIERLAECHARAEARPTPEALDALVKRFDALAETVEDRLFTIDAIARLIAFDELDAEARHRLAWVLVDLAKPAPVLRDMQLHRVSLMQLRGHARHRAQMEATAKEGAADA